MQDHKVFLAHTPAIKQAGPLLRSGVADGGLWLVEATSLEEVERLVHTDPFWPTGLRAGYDIHEWRRVYISS
jgi:uncharacterized protein YciI